MRVYAAVRRIYTLGGGVPSKIPAGSGPRDWIIQAMLQETRQNPMNTHSCLGGTVADITFRIIAFGSNTNNGVTFRIAASESNRKNVLRLEPLLLKVIQKWYYV